MLIDHAVIFVRSGKGGDGVVSFRRAKFEPKGGPNGGDGGKGGDVILRAEPGVDTLLDFSGRHHWRASDGEPGGSKQKHGSDGADLEIRLPPGTLVYDNDTGELLVDLAAPDQRVVIVRGGKGGFGNEHFKSPTNQTPRQTTPGEPAVELNLRLELKLVADIGLVGLPNAGKSTLLSRITRARPKVADYPFTTLEPNLGIAELSGERRLVFADIPGLIEGASGGAGLGHAFLRHIERTRVLVHLIDIAPADGSDPIENYMVIREELAGYSLTLANKPQIVAASKMDLMIDDARRDELMGRLNHEIRGEIMAISSASGAGLDALLEACWRVTSEARAAEPVNPID